MAAICLPSASCNSILSLCNGIDDPSVAISSEYDTFEKPIRVINIKKTLAEKQGIHFLKPQDWKFHVLSHTWSQAVRDFSRQIGNAINGSEADENAYNRAFEKETFSENDECYRLLLEIFERLHADGADLLWFDALCINQISDDEKCHEINNMGSYFSLSMGTYVLTQGVDKVNGIHPDTTVDDDENALHLPRWFSRVWTFQEFLLPKQLSFLVEGGIDQRFVAMVNCLIREQNKRGFCKCFLNMQNEELVEIFVRSFEEEDLMWIGGFELRNPKWKSIAQLIKERSPPDCASGDGQFWDCGLIHYGYKDVCSKCDDKTNKNYQRKILHTEMQRVQSHNPNSEAYGDKPGFEHHGKSISCCEEACKECSSRPMIRRAKHIHGREEMTYFVDREVFLGLMQCHSRMAEIASQGKLGEVPSKEVQALRGLYCAWATEGNWKPCHAICEVGWRECTNEEDRVLAILGLLGLRLKQLRTKKTLREQVLELAKAGGSGMLVELCVLSQKGGPFPLMSWAPDFHGFNRKLEYASLPRLISIRFQHLHPDGQLQVEVKMLSGSVFKPHYATPTKSSPGFDYLLVLESSIHEAQGPTTKSSNPIMYFPLIRHEEFLERLKRSDQEHKPRKILPFDFKQDETAQLCGAFEVPINKDHKVGGDVSFSVRLLLLGEDDIGRSLFLVCIPDKVSPHKSTPCETLHKIGALSIANMPAALRSSFHSSAFYPCVIGALGEDLTDYIHFH